MNTIAHVGHTKTHDDTERIFKVLEWLEERDALCLAKANPDWIDLSRGRDFLAEDKKYDVVVLHFIFRGGLYTKPKKGKHPLRISPHATWGNWRKRLVDTGAKYIFAFGGFAEVGGSYIVSLDGYHRVEIEPEFYAFEKL